MPSSSVCWGIEVGSFAVKAIKLEMGSDGPRVAEYAIIPHARTLSEPDVDQDDAKRMALNRLVNEYDLSGATIAISVPGHSAFARFAKLPPVEQKKVPQIVKFEAVQQIPFPLEEVEWDFQTFQDPESPDVEVGIFAVTKERIASDLALLAEVGISPDVVTLSPVAAYNAMAWDLEFTEQTPGTVLLDIGTTATDLIVADSGRVWVRTFPIGGHEFTQALVEAFKLSYPKAEKLKREAETSKHARHVFQALRPVFNDLAQDIQRSIGYYQSLHRDADLTRLIGTGSTFELPGIRKFLKQQLGLNVYRLEKFKRLPLEGPQAAEFEAVTPQLVTVTGLALQGLGQATLNANVIPVKVVRDAMWRRKTKWFVTAAGLGLAAAGSLFIGPFLSQTQLDSIVPDESIDRAISLGGRLTSEANDAGVTEPLENNFQAANIISVFDDREVFGWLAADTSAMVQSGQQHGFELVSMTSDYRYYPDGQAAPAANRGGDDFGGGRGMRDDPEDGGLRSARGGRRGENTGRGRSQTEEPERFEERGGGGDAPAGQPEPRVAVELVISTTAAREALDEAITASVLQWLAQNAQRAPAPYVLRLNPDGQPWTMVASGQEGEGQQASQLRQRFDPPTRTPSGRPSRGQAAEQEFEERLAQERREGNVIGGARGSGGGDGGRSREAMEGQLEAIAPIERPEREGDRSTFRVQFEAVLKQDGQSASNGGDA